MHCMYGSLYQVTQDYYLVNVFSLQESSWYVIIKYKDLEE